MRVKSRYSLQRTMIIYFLLIGFASVLVSAEFMADFSRGALKSEIWQNMRQYGQEQQYQEQIFAPIDRMRSKAVLMIGIVMLVMVIVLTMFIRNITDPLQHMIRVSEKISSGDLSPTIRIDANNELADLAGVINDMATNLQEIILLTHCMCTNGRTFTQNTLAQLRDRPLGDAGAAHLERAVKKMEADFKALDDVIDYFHIYSVEKIENGR